MSPICRAGTALKRRLTREDFQGCILKVFPRFLGFINYPRPASMCYARGMTSGPRRPPKGSCQHAPEWFSLFCAIFVIVGFVGVGLLLQMMILCLLMGLLFRARELDDSGKVIQEKNHRFLGSVCLPTSLHSLYCTTCNTHMWPKIRKIFANMNS